MLVRVAALAALLLAACAADFAEEPSRPEAPTTMSTPIPDAPAPPAAPPPILRASFEPASADCNGWTAEGARSIRSVPARTGSYACKLCADGSRGDIALSHSLGALAPGRYVFSAYTRKRPQNAAPAAAIASLEAETSTGARRFDAETFVRDDWDRLEATIDVPDGASSLAIKIGSPAAATDDCVLIDDVSIERAN